MQTCPMCGEWVATDAVECQFCGENLGGVQRVEDPSLARVRTGIALVYVGLVLMLLTIIGGIALVAVLRGDPRALQVIAVLAIAAAVIGFVGKLMCLAVPPAVGATGVIYTSVAIDMLTILLRLASFVVELPPALAMIVGLAGIVAYVLFILFLERLANYIERPDLANLARGVLTAGALGVALYLVGLAMLVAEAGPGIAALMMLVAFVVLLVAFLRYARVLHGLKAAI